MPPYRFSAKIEAANSGGAYVLFPYDVQTEFGTKGKIPIKATFNGVPYTGTMIRYGHPQHMLPILKAIREQIGKAPGDKIDVVVWKDDSVRTLEVPAPFLSRLRRAGLLASFEKLSYTHRREYVRWITEAKKEETRARRLDKAIEMLGKGTKTPG